MGSTPSSGNQKETVAKFEQGPVKIVQDLKNDSILKEIVANVNKELLALKPSQSVNLEKTKNQTKVKKVKDIRSLHSLKDIKLQNNENEIPLAQLKTD